jgi:anthranilate 1,2-dioxygenase reductase subunit
MPGQYVHLSIPGSDQNRSYSFANPPLETGQYTFYIKILEQGAMSNYLAREVKLGDQMDVTGPFGRFYLRPLQRPVLMVAGGTGLAPMLSMLDTMVIQGDVNHTVRLLYGANQPDELFGLDKIAGYKDQGLDVSMELSIVDPDANWNGTTGHVTSLLRSELLNGGNCDVYLCGPPPMIDAAETWLSENGVDRSRVNAEKFVPS